MYLLVVEQNEPDEIIEFARNLGLSCTVEFGFLFLRIYLHEEMLWRDSMYLDFKRSAYDWYNIGIVDEGLGSFFLDVIVVLSFSDPYFL